MAFWDNIGETISAKGKVVADKAKNFTDIASLKGQIVTQENAIARYYKEIGREYYAAHKEDENPECYEHMAAIRKAEGIIDELQKKIAELSGSKHCDTCGSDVAEDCVFCPKCGAKFEEDAYFDEEDTEGVVVREIVDAFDAEVVDSTQEEPQAETVVSEEC